MLRTILIVILILLLIGALPTWPYSSGLGLLSLRWLGSVSCLDYRPYIGLSGTDIAAIGRKLAVMFF